MKTLSGKLILNFCVAFAMSFPAIAQDGGQAPAKQQEPNWDGAYEKCSQSCFEGGPCFPDSKKKCRVRVNTRKKQWEHAKCQAIQEKFDQKECFILAKNSAAKMDDAENFSDDDQDEMKACKRNFSSDQDRAKCMESSNAQRKSKQRNQQLDAQMNADLEKNANERIAAQLKAGGVQMMPGGQAVGGKRAPASNGTGYSSNAGSANTYKPGGGTGSVQYSNPGSGTNTYKSGGAAGTPTYR
ncbi:MAG: hypothetical protein JNL01_01085 [Bdellovibrionales bacterium]|nr:hypothetical protein [Bdellovibrionales bacterium]